MKISRRHFLVAVPSAVVSAIAVSELGKLSAPPGPKRYLRRHFHYLEVDDAVLDRYLEDYARAFGASALEDRHRLATTLLLSTDFFQTGADESRPLNYVVLYSPYHAPCFNPLG